MTVYDVLERKKGALDYDKNHFNIIEKYGIHLWQKNLKFLPSWLFSEKDSSMMLHDVLDWKEGFLNYKNIIFYKKGLDMIFDDDLHNKEAFLDYYYDILTSSKN